MNKTSEWPVRKKRNICGSRISYSDGNKQEYWRAPITNKLSSTKLRFLLVWRLFFARMTRPEMLLKRMLGLVPRLNICTSVSHA